MKTLKFAIPFLIFAALVFTGCGSSSDNGTAAGVKSMKDTLGTLQKSVDANDAAKVKEGAEQLEEQWEKFEDSVKEKSKELYEKVETPLHTIEAGAKAATLDKNTLSKAITDLNNALTEVEK